MQDNFFLEKNKPSKKQLLQKVLAQLIFSVTTNSEECHHKFGQVTFHPELNIYFSHYLMRTQKHELKH